MTLAHINYFLKYFIANGSQICWQNSLISEVRDCWRLLIYCSAKGRQESKICDRTRQVEHCWGEGWLRKLIEAGSCQDSTVKYIVVNQGSTVGCLGDSGVKVQDMANELKTDWLVSGHVWKPTAKQVEISNPNCYFCDCHYGLGYHPPCQHPLLESRLESQPLYFQSNCLIIYLERWWKMAQWLGSLPSM